MNTIYVVWGESGHYEDHMTWNVAAFKNKADAEARVKQEKEEFKKAKAPFDDEADFDIEELELHD